MTIGTKSVLFGVHCFFIHPLVVALGWWKLYGLRRVAIGERRVRVRVNGLPVVRPVTVTTSLRDPRLWVAFIVHDLGYLGKPNMDGEEGEQHPFVGARVMRRLFGPVWYEFTLYHSRFLAKRFNAKPSALCMADKMAIVVEPAWLYLPRVRWSGEIHEYMGKSDRNNGTGSKYAGMHLSTASQEEWFRDCKAYVRRWIAEHKDGREDTWTPSGREAVTSSGVHR